MSHTRAADAMADDPVSYEGTTVLIDARRMEVGRHYWLLFRNLRTVATKQADGSVEFYRIPPQAPKWLIDWMLWLSRPWA